MPLQKTSRIDVNPADNVSSPTLYGNSFTPEQLPYVKQAAVSQTSML